MGDIAGKGVPAALMMASLQASLRSHYALGPGDLVARLQSMNRLFHECTAPGHFATLFLGEYDDRTRALRYANCGHPPGLLLRGDGNLERLGSTAMVLGIREEWACGLAETRLSPGDTLLLYTDGATEARDAAGEEFGEERLAEALRAARGLALPELAEAVAQAVRRFCGEKPAATTSRWSWRGRCRPAPSRRSPPGAGARDGGGWGRGSPCRSTSIRETRFPSTGRSCGR